MLSAYLCTCCTHLPLAAACGEGHHPGKDPGHVLSGSASPGPDLAQGT